MQREGRLDRQLCIEGWDQRALAEANIGVVGDDDLLASVYILSSASLGINNMVVIAPRVDATLLEIAHKLNPALKLILLEGFYTHPILDGLFDGCRLIVDLTQYGLANKLLLEKGFRENRAILRGFCAVQDGEEGFRVFTYLRGREWQELEQVVSPRNLPGPHWDDGVFDLIVAGILLEETKNILTGREASTEVITYKRKGMAAAQVDPSICVVGAGALGTFVGLGLAYAGFRRVTFIDPDVVDATNLNRQVLFYDAVGLSKAVTLSERLRALFGVNATPCTTSFGGDTNLFTYDAIFDCVDNFETRIVLSEKCKDQNKVLISGGTSIDAGQVVVYDPKQGGGTPAEVLGLYDIIEERKIDTGKGEGEPCALQPDPSVIMTNQIIAGFMVDAYRMLLDGQEPTNIFYDSKSHKRM